MIAMPPLAWAESPIRERIALAQVAPIPVALGATIAFASFGEVPWQLAAQCSLVLCMGLVASAIFIPHVGTRWLRRVAAVPIVGAAIGVLPKVNG